MMINCRRLWWVIVTLLALAGWGVDSHAHQDPCHRLHSCPSDHGSYVCGDRGRCDQCPDNQYCLAGKLRVASSPTPAPAPPAPLPSATTTPSAVTACFTPGGNCTGAIVKALSEAKRTILVQAYSFTSAPIAKALLDAHKRGVQVQVILDKSQRTEKYSSADFLANQGVPTMIDTNHAIAHNKVILIDSETVSRAHSTLRRRPRRRTRRTCSSSAIRPLPRSTRRTGTPIASIVSRTSVGGCVSD